MKAASNTCSTVGERQPLLFSRIKVMNGFINMETLFLFQVSWSGSHEGHGKQYYEFNHVDRGHKHHHLRK